VNAHVSIFCFFAYDIVFVFSGRCVSAPDGYYWPCYAIMAGLAIVPIVAGTKIFRILGILGLVFALVLIVVDARAGVRQRAQFRELRNKIKP